MRSAVVTHYHTDSAPFVNDRLCALASYFSIPHWGSLRSLSMPTSPGDLWSYNMLVWPLCLLQINTIPLNNLLQRTCQEWDLLNNFNSEDQRKDQCLHIA